MGACLVSGDDVIKGFKDVVGRLHAKNIKVIGATVVSSFGSPIGSYGFPKIDTERKKVNDFIRTGGLFDAVADMDAATLDPATGAMKAPMQPNQTTGPRGAAEPQPGRLSSDGRNDRPEAVGAFAWPVAGKGCAGTPLTEACLIFPVSRERKSFGGPCTKRKMCR